MFFGTASPCQLHEYAPQDFIFLRCVPCIYKSPRSLQHWQDKMKAFHISSNDSNVPIAEIIGNVGQGVLSYSDGSV